MSDVFSGFDSVNPRNQNEITSKTFSAEVDNTPAADFEKDPFAGFNNISRDEYVTPNREEITIKDFETTNAEKASIKDENKDKNSNKSKGLRKDLLVNTAPEEGESFKISTRNDDRSD